MRPRGGYTLIEIAVVLAVVGILLAIAMPPLARWRDEMAARAARDEVAAAIALTRIAAVAHGGAALVLDPDSRGVRGQTADGAWSPPLDLGHRYGVAVDVGSEAAVEIRFDALGIGRFGNRTVTIRRGRAAAGLTVSAYGRVRRW